MAAQTRSAPTPTATTTRWILLLTPPLLLASTYLVYTGLVQILGPKLGYFLGFLFYWGFWCLLLPLSILGHEGVRRLFGDARPRLGASGWLGLILLIAPPIAAFTTVGLRYFPHAGVAVLLSSAVIALINGALEELLWRGTYISVFPGNLWLGHIYPSIGFGVWHFAPQAIYPNSMPGGTLSLVVSAAVLGLMWGWVAWRTKSIRWTTLSHVFLNFSGLGGRIYFG